jgi:uncharacterized protein (TIGR03032 family)
VNLPCRNNSAFEAAIVSDTIQCQADEGFAEWISRFPGTLALTTYQAGKLIFVGWDGRQVTILPRNFDKPTGLAIAPLSSTVPSRFALATKFGVTLFADAPALAGDVFQDQPTRYDALYLPRGTYHTGELSTHDLAYAADGLWLVNTRFSCLARLSEAFSFVPLWKPPFVSEMVPEDRCHLNGMCVVDGLPSYVTCLGESDAVEGWRENRSTGGVIVDVQSGTIVARGLSMPHSPRWHAGRLWFLNSGAGEVCTLDPATGQSTVVFELAGYLRGLCLLDSFALVGLCQIREQHLFGGLAVQARWRNLKCGIALIDLEAGRQIGLLEFTGGCTEVFDIGLIAGPRCAMVMNLEREESRQAIALSGLSYWFR